MSHRPRVVNGVKHGRRCCCTFCDPGQTMLAAANLTARERPAPAISPHIAAARYVARAYAPRRTYDGPSPESRRFIELLREGRTAAEALDIIATEKETLP